MPAWVSRALLLFAFLAVLVVAFGQGLGRSYIVNADPDIVFTYQALLLNDGDSHINAEHTGYVYFVLLAFTLRAFRLIGFLHSDRVSGIENLSPDDFDIAYTEVIVAGRILSIVIALALVAAVFFAARLATRNTLAASLAAALTGASWGTTTQALILRTELLSVVFVMIAFTALLAAARSADNANGRWLLLAGLTVALALATKLQAVFSLLALPLLALSFGQTPPAYARSLTRAERVVLTMLLALGSAAPVFIAAAMLVSGMIERKSPGLYQVAIAIYLAAAIAAYSAIYRVTIQRTVNGIVALALGFSIGILLHLLYRNPEATDALGAFVEHMKVYGGIADSDVLHVALIRSLKAAVIAATERRVEGLRLFTDPFLIVEWSVVIGIAINWRGGRRLIAGRALLLLATAVGVEILSRIRGLPLHYLVFIDPWGAIAAAVTLTPFLENTAKTWRSVASIVGVLVIALLHFPRALGDNFPARQQRENACYQAEGMPRVMAQFRKFCQPAGAQG